MNIKQLFELQEQDADKLPLLLQTISHSKNEGYVLKAINIIQQSNHTFNPNQQLSIIDFINAIKKEYDIAIDIKLISTLLHIIDINWMQNSIQFISNVHNLRQFNYLIICNLGNTLNCLTYIIRLIIRIFGNLFFNPPRQKLNKNKQQFKLYSLQLILQFRQGYLHYFTKKWQNTQKLGFLYFQGLQLFIILRYIDVIKSIIKNKFCFIDINIYLIDGRSYIIARLNNQFIHKIIIKRHFKNCNS
ncbi:unnamed protein product [Paramecium pentaurelia]|uniref:Uncharacterized protein n=1 Tax=Paramecium pentaurelia TaxID=43138 RepID=A0A8S1XE46_9CILI|nr:unnamed protein product [Paramecium pentaurelia]